ncbi:MAG: pilus assembly FimT family protein [Bacillota bacterium]
MTGKPAFTLVELVIVLAITCILSASAFPVMVAAYHKQTLYLAARLLMADIQEQQQVAVSHPEKVTYQVLLDVQKDCYYLRLGGQQVLRTVRLPSNVDLDEGSSFGSATNDKLLEFKYNGGVQLREAGRVILRDKDSGQRCYVIVTPFTGRVRVSTAPP